MRTKTVSMANIDAAPYLGVVGVLVEPLHEEVMGLEGAGPVFVGGELVTQEESERKKNLIRS